MHLILTATCSGYAFEKSEQKTTGVSSDSAISALAAPQNVKKPVLRMVYPHRTNCTCSTYNTHIPLDKDQLNITSIQYINVYHYITS